MRKRLVKKLTKNFLSSLICGSQSGPFLVVWSDSWYAALSVDALRSFKRKFRDRYCKSLELSGRDVVELFDPSETASQCNGPVTAIPAYKLPPQKVLRCV